MSPAVISPLDGVVYGIVQGVAEFIPISSSGQLRLAQTWLNPGTDIAGFEAFTAILRIGTTAALLLFFWRELVHVGMAWLRGLLDKKGRGTLEYRMGWYLVLATVPVIVLDIVFSRQLDGRAQNLWVVAIALLATALLLAAAEWWSGRRRVEEDIDGSDAAAIGAGQVIGLIPGVSAPTAMIAAGIFRGLDRTTAARFAFLLSMPAVVGTTAFGLRKIGEPTAPGMGITIVATMIAFALGLTAIWWLLRFLARHSTLIFIAYRVAIGAVIITLLSVGSVSAT